MASIHRQQPDNVSGDFFVDASCIDCGTCCRVAPESFAEAADHSYVFHQPQDEPARARARMALIACPVGAIGTVAKHDLDTARDAFPAHIAPRVPGDEDVMFCGWVAENTYGAASYFIRRPGGNVLVDSPRFASTLVRRLEAK